MLYLQNNAKSAGVGACEGVLLGLAVVGLPDGADVGDTVEPHVSLNMPDGMTLFALI